MAPRRSGLTAAALIVVLIGAPESDAPHVAPPGQRPQHPERPVWLFFDPSAWADQAAPDLAPAARARRERAGFSGTPLPGAPAGVREALAAVGVSIRAESRWLRSVSITGSASAIRRALALPGVRGMRPVALQRLGSADGTARQDQSGFQGKPGGVAASMVVADALRALGVPAAHALGLSGAGVRVGIIAGAFRLDHRDLPGVHVLATRDFVGRDSVVTTEPGQSERDATLGTALLFLAAGSTADGTRGPAFASSFALARTDEADAAPVAEEDRWVEALEWLEGIGADIVISGVGFRLFDDFEHPFDSLDGTGTPAARAAAEAAHRGVLVVTPVGNEGPGARSLLAPADADGALAVGAADEAGAVTAFTGLGPTADGRPKPDLLAPGIDLLVAGPGAADEQVVASGTEHAAALAGAAAALFAEAYPDRSPAAVSGALIASARGRTDRPTAGGLAVPDVASAILFPDGFEALPLAAVDGEGSVTTLTPEFLWEAHSLDPRATPIAFRLQLSRDSTFGTVAVEDTVVDAFSGRLDRPLPPRSRLFWRVEARTAVGVDRRSAVEGPFTVPPWVALRTLDVPGGTTIDDPTPTLIWTAFDVTPPAGPLGFEVQILSDRDAEPLLAFPDLTERRFRVPEPLPFNTPLRWRVIARTPAGLADTATSTSPFVVTSRERPPVTILFQNFPNPFPERVGPRDTRIWFDLATPSEVHLAVYDIRGRLVRSLVPRQGCDAVVMESGSYGRDEGLGDPCVQLRWDGRDERGREVAPGVYLLRLRAGSVENVRRMLFWP